MNEHPILFSTEMVKAILDGRKTQTRRVINPQPVNDGNIFYDPHWLFRETPLLSLINKYKKMFCPYGTPGDLLWVRETFAYDKDDKGNHGGVAYKADGSGIHVTVRDFDTGERYELPWKPSIFMPRWASRITLEVVSVQVERVQDISEADAKAEGVEAIKSHRVYPSSQAAWAYSYRDGFAKLWNAINGKRGYSFESNPFVWVVEFKKI